jgi:hypothetical protein
MPVLLELVSAGRQDRVVGLGTAAVCADEVSEATETTRCRWDIRSQGGEESFRHLAVHPKQSIGNSIVVRNCPNQGSWKYRQQVRHVTIRGYSD